MVGLTTASPEVADGLLGQPLGPLNLRVATGPHAGRVLEIKANKCLIGSSTRCTLRLDAAGVMPIHCLILRGHRKTFVRRWARDTRVNGGRFTDTTLNTGDTLSVGPFDLEVLAPSTHAAHSLAHSAGHAAPMPPASFDTSKLENRLHRIERLLADDSNSAIDQLRQQWGQQFHHICARLDEVQAATVQMESQASQWPQIIQEQLAAERALFQRQQDELLALRTEVERLGEQAEGTRTQLGQIASVADRIGKIEHDFGQVLQQVANLQADTADASVLDTVRSEAERLAVNLESTRGEFERERESWREENNRLREEVERYRGEFESQQQLLADAQRELQDGFQELALQWRDLKDQPVTQPEPAERFADRPAAELMDEVSPSALTDYSTVPTEHEPFAGHPGSTSFDEPSPARDYAEAPEYTPGASYTPAAGFDPQLPLTAEAPASATSHYDDTPEYNSPAAAPAASYSEDATFGSPSAEPHGVMSETDYRQGPFAHEQYGQEQPQHEQVAHNQYEQGYDRQETFNPDEYRPESMGELERASDYVADEPARAEPAFDQLMREETSVAVSESPAAPQESEESGSGSGMVTADLFKQFYGSDQSWNDEPAQDPDSSAAGHDELERTVLDDVQNLSSQTAHANAVADHSEPAEPAAEAKHQDDESIEGYMERLLMRVRGGDSADEPPPSAPKTNSKSIPLASKPPVAEACDEGDEPASPKEYAPRSTAPELASDLSAMRDLANQTARTAISTSTKKKSSSAAAGKMVTAGVVAVCSAALLAISPDWNQPVFWGGVCGLLLASMWGLQSVGLAARSLVASFKKN